MFVSKRSASFRVGLVSSPYPPISLNALLPASVSDLYAHEYCMTDTLRQIVSFLVTKRVSMHITPLMDISALSKTTFCSAIIYRVITLSQHPPE